jgi:hypothetical protein
MGWSDFSKVKKIGEGSFGKAWLVRNHKDQISYVIKEISISRASTFNFIGVIWDPSYNSWLVLRCLLENEMRHVRKLPFWLKWNIRTLFRISTHLKVDISNRLILMLKIYLRGIFPRTWQFVYCYGLLRWRWLIFTYYVTTQRWFQWRSSK